jgi:general secretion pathway protein G
MKRFQSLGLACVLAIGASTLPKAASAQSAMTFYQQCGNGWTAGILHRGYCHSYVTGLVNGLAARGGLICLPQGVTDTQLVMIVQAYMRSHPGQLNRSANAVIAESVTLTYPCRQFVDDARVRSAKTQISNMSAALELFRLDVGRYPTQAEGIDALLDDPMTARGWHGPYLKRPAAVYDPWGHKFRYRVPGAHGSVDLFSFGPGDAQPNAGKPLVANW